MAVLLGRVQSGASSPPVVLVIERDPVIRSLLCEICRGEGYRFVLADGAEAAIHTVKTSEIHLVLLACSATDLSSYEVCRHLRSETKVNVIMLSASLDDSSADRASEAGAIALLRKPFRLHELTLAMRAALEDFRMPSDPPTVTALTRRRDLAGALGRIESALSLRARLRKEANRSAEPRTCFVVRLENEVTVARQEGRSGRDAAIGLMGQALLEVAGDGSVFWADYGELVCLAAASVIEQLREAATRAQQGAHEAGLGNVRFCCGAMRYAPGENLDADCILPAARAAVEEASRAGQFCCIEALDDARTVSTVS